jgi:hypothetical protein
VRRHALPISLALVTQALPAQAASPAAWSPAVGADCGDCLISPPRGTFPYALAPTGAGGTINVLSADGFAMT